MRTDLCDLIGIELPIIQAPMGSASCPALAAAVSNAGGLGMLALSWTKPSDVRQIIRETRNLTQRPFGNNLVLDWPQEERLAICLEEKVRVISLFFGSALPFVDRIHAAGSLACVTVGSAKEARTAVADGVNFVVAQGWEAGGHVSGQVATIPLVRAVVSAVAPTPVVAAGGIADGPGLAAVLVLGASAAWIGTRFMASQEAAIHPLFREMLISSNETDTVSTELFDVGWPGRPHRVLRNKTINAWEAAGRPPSGKRPGEGELLGKSQSRGPIVRYQSTTPPADATGDIEAFSLFAGQSVGLVRKMQPAAEIVREIAEGAEIALRQFSARQ
jgi:NAD(P)H-dependent flavin oxidoreductase YrpB (nitropropane dioxygenase family)